MARDSEASTLNLDLQLELSLRLVIAAALGLAVGLERELHAHPAGMRTHLLVAVGCALFTELSIHGFNDGPAGTAPVDPSRIAAQIVTGMGFIGAGAILKYGASIRGLTTAASLWATAAVGIAVGTGQYLLAAVGASIVVFSLWPLQRFALFVRMRNAQPLRVRLAVDELEALEAISNALRVRRVTIDEVRTQRRDDSRFEIELELRTPPGARLELVIATINALPGVDLLDTDRAVE